MYYTSLFTSIYAIIRSFDLFDSLELDVLMSLLKKQERKKRTT